MTLIINSKFPLRSAYDGSIGLGVDDLVPLVAGRGGILRQKEGRMRVLTKSDKGERGGVEGGSITQP